MTDFDRFVEFLRREAKTYNQPPATPAATMWIRVRDELAFEAPELETRELETGPTSSAETPLASEDLVTSAARRYHEPPSPPRDEMWERIEAGWAMRRAAPAGVREAGLTELAEDLPGFEIPETERSERRSVALWVTGVAVAASILFGIVIGRGMPPLERASTRVAVEPRTDTGAPTDVALQSTAGGASTASADEGPGDGARSNPGDVEMSAPEADRLETAPRLAARDPGRVDDRDVRTPSSIEERSTMSVDRRSVVARYATTAHLGRTETLLTSFRADDGSPDQFGELARSARNLLGETRLLLDMDIERSPGERALLEEIELLLAQIARLGPDAPSFEREIIAEGLERMGTVATLRDASPQLGT